MKLSAKIAVSLLAAFIFPVAVIGWFSFNSILSFTHSSYRDILRDKAAGHANAVNALTSTIKEGLEVSSEYPVFKLLLNNRAQNLIDSLNNSQAETVEFIKNMITANEKLKEVYLVDNNGVIAASRYSDDINRPFSDICGALGSFKSWSDYKIMPYADKHNNKYLLAYMKITDDSGSKIGAVVELYSVSSLEDLIYASRFGNTGSVIVLDMQGTVVLPNEASQRVAPTFYRSLPTVSLIIEQMRYGDLKIHSDEIQYPLNNKKMCGYYNYIPELNCLVLASIEKNEIELKAKETITIIIVVSFLYLLIMPAVVYMISRQLTNPINKIAESLENVKNGNFDFVCDYDKPDEFGILVQSFNTMASALNRTNTELLHNQQKYKLVLEDISDVIWEWNLSTNDFKIYGKWNEIFGYDLSNTGSRNLFAQQIHAEDKLKFLNEFNLYVTGKKDYFNAEYRILNAAGEYIWVACKATAINNLSGRSSIIMGTISDINERKLSELQVQQLAYRDTLTGVFSRQALKQGVVELVKNKPKILMSLIMIDLDHFKTANDTYGHSFGDEVLKFVGLSLLDCLREDDLVGRIGGDEFVVFIAHADSIGAIENVCKRIMNAVCKKVNINGIEYQISCSVGAAIYPYHGDTMETLFNCADKAMYNSKNQGRGQYYLLSKDEVLDNVCVGAESISL